MLSKHMQNYTNIAKSKQNPCKEKQQLSKSMQTIQAEQNLSKALIWSSKT
jgi:hypothetical protein